MRRFIMLTTYVFLYIFSEYKKNLQVWKLCQTSVCRHLSGLGAVQGYLAHRFPRVFRVLFLARTFCAKEFLLCAGIWLAEGLYSNTLKPKH